MNEEQKNNDSKFNSVFDDDWLDKIDSETEDMEKRFMVLAKKINKPHNEITIRDIIELEN